MADAALTWSPQNGWADVSIAAGDLQAGNDLETAVIISLFTDREANPDDVIPDGSGDPRGWWGDAFLPYKIGSRLWLLERGKAMPDVVQRATDYVNEALAWMLTEQLCSGVDVKVELISTPVAGLGIDVVIRRGAQPPVALKYAWAWQGIG
jgi:phage gp46-like protein